MNVPRIINGIEMSSDFRKIKSIVCASITEANRIQINLVYESM